MNKIKISRKKLAIIYNIFSKLTALIWLIATIGLIVYKDSSLSRGEQIGVSIFLTLFFAFAELNVKEGDE